MFGQLKTEFGRKRNRNIARIILYDAGNDERRRRNQEDRNQRAAADP